MKKGQKATYGPRVERGTVVDRLEDARDGGLQVTAPLARDSDGWEGLIEDTGFEALGDVAERSVKTINRRRKWANLKTKKALEDALRPRGSNAGKRAKWLD